MSWRLLVTGVTGMLGQQITRRLEQREMDFVAACRQDAQAFQNMRPLFMDYSQPASLELAFRNIDVLFLLIPFSENMKAWATNAIEAAQRAGVKLIVRTTAMRSDSRSPYLWLKMEGEINDLLDASGVPSILIKTNSFMQNYERHYAEALRHGALYLPEGEGRTSFIDVGDLANVIADVLVNPFDFLGSHYVITGGRALSNAEAVSIFSLKARRRISYVPITEEVTRRALEKINTSPWWIDFTLSRHRSIRDGLGKDVTSTFQEITGRAPKTFEEFSEEFAEQLRWPEPSPDLGLR